MVNILLIWMKTFFMIWKLLFHTFKDFGQVTAIGHSLGCRFALISGADFAIGISPALPKTFTPQTQGIPCYRN